MKFLVEIPDNEVDEAIEDSDSDEGPLTVEQLIQFSLEENFGVPGGATIKVTRMESGE